MMVLEVCVINLMQYWVSSKWVVLKRLTEIQMHPAAVCYWDGSGKFPNVSLFVNLVRMWL